ncbi:hypothetical protein P154DRAFT_120986 [Amniculicola lignicola CBS 123094]|uniref:Uncharacterized protein n=1 Tax=Amniculicola lignicola CBS 123094 TaxID=1392246 RepID=A0A6A5X3U3_9PLEO|nr:hypothetical protein P154DRAFT_120986 [Amniculicola lignicola CBS 123094]
MASPVILSCHCLSLSSKAWTPCSIALSQIPNLDSLTMVSLSDSSFILSDLSTQLPDVSLPYLLSTLSEPSLPSTSVIVLVAPSIPKQLPGSRAAMCGLGDEDSMMVEREIEKARAKARWERWKKIGYRVGQVLFWAYNVMNTFYLWLFWSRRLNLNRATPPSNRVGLEGGEKMLEA